MAAKTSQSHKATITAGSVTLSVDTDALGRIRPFTLVTLDAPAHVQARELCEAVTALIKLVS